MFIHFRQSIIRRLQVERAALDLGLEGNISTSVKLVSGLIGSVYSQSDALAGWLCTMMNQNIWKYKFHPH